MKEENAPLDRLERRREPRVQVDRLVYIRASDSVCGHFEEVRTMRDLSRSGFYFVTERDSYKTGARLHVVPAFGCLNLEYIGEVVRVEELPSQEFGVAVRLVRVEHMVASPRSNTSAAFESFAMADSEPVEFAQCESDR